MSIMCDWMTFKVISDVPLVFGGTFTKSDDTGQVIYEGIDFKQCEGSHSSSILVKSAPVGQFSNGLYIHGNPTKFLQGHNLFGLFDLNMLAHDTVKLIFDKLGIYDLGTLQRLKRGDYDLSRLDITASFRLKDTDEVRTWIKHATTFASGKLQGVSDYRGKTIYFGKNSRHRSHKFYCKADDKFFLQDCKNFAENKSQFLLDFSQGLLRSELTLRRMKLRQMGIFKGFHWDESLARGLFNEQLKNMNLTGQYELESEDFESMPSKFQKAYKLHKAGMSLQEMYSRATYYRYKKYFLENYNINIDVPHNPERGQVVPLIKVLQAEPVEIPDEAFNLDLVHNSNGQRR